VTRCLSTNYLKAIVPLVLVAAFLSHAYGQDPTVVVPESYKLQFENDSLRVLRVHYAAHQKVRVHNHSRFPAAYVYLNDAGPVNFIHTGWQDPILTRRAVKARTLRLSRTSSADETHSVDNISNTDTDFLRIEFRTLRQGESLAFIRYEPERYDKAKPFTKVLFDNPEFRATRMAAPARSELSVTANNDPALVTLLTAGRIDGVDQPMGHTVWLAAGKTLKIVAPTNGEVEIFRFDLKTTSKQASSH